MKLHIGHLEQRAKAAAKRCGSKCASTGAGDVIIVYVTDDNGFEYYDRRSGPYCGFTRDEARQL